MAQDKSYIDATDADFAQVVLQSEQPVLVDFWAAWCPPCRALAPAIEGLAAQYAGKAKVVKVDVDQARQTASAYGIQSIPTIAFFVGGREVDRVVGVQPAGALAARLDRLLPQPA
jgi:thioredoxin 1